MGGDTTLTANDGKQAPELLQKPDTEAVDLIITNANMPNTDDVTFIKVLKKLPAYALTPECVLTTEMEQGRLETEMLKLKDAWITKPMQLAHILNIAGKLLAD